MMSGRVERRVLATVLLHPDMFDQFWSVSTWFSVRRHKIIWNAMHMARNGLAGVIDMISVSRELERFDYLDEIGGAAYLSELLDSISPNENPLDVVAEWRNRPILNDFFDRPSD